MAKEDIIRIVERNLPSGFSVSEQYIDATIKEWQLYLYRAVPIPPIPEEAKYDLSLYSPEWQAVLAYCVIYDILLKVISGNILFAGVTSSEDGEISTGSDVKKITTGPTDVEYFNTRETWSKLMRGWNEPGGFMELFFSKACMAASIVKVKLPFCAAKNITSGPKAFPIKPRCVKLCRKK